MNNNDRPFWTTVEPGWPTRSERIGGATLGVPVAWQTAAPLPPAGGVTETAFTGPLPGDLLAVGVMPEADPAHNLQLWVDGVLAFVGVPHPALADWRLIQWAAEGEQSGWAADLGIDTCATYQGFLVNGRDLCRCYVMLARRGTMAWRIILSFSSALPPGADNDAIEAGDHVRAAAVFAGLTLN